jgi:hypothetical protein
MPKIAFTKSVFSSTEREKLKKEIISATESNPELRKEIRRVFHQANRRIENVESAGLLSPAVKALNRGNIDGFSKFAVGELSWEELKREYAKAIAFLRQPTSTASGTRQYNEHIKSAYDLTDEEFNLMADKINDKLQSISDSDFVEKYLMRYKDFTGELESEAADVSSQIESDAVSLENALQRDIENKANETVNKAENEIKGLVNDLLSALGKFGL